MSETISIITGWPAPIPPTALADVFSLSAAPPQPEENETE
jgi:hypothetical protein